MPIDPEATIASNLAGHLVTLDPTGFGALSSADQAALEAKLLTAIAREMRAQLLQADVSVSGTTASACTAGGSSGTCDATGSLT